MLFPNSFCLCHFIRVVILDVTVVIVVLMEEENNIFNLTVYAQTPSMFIPFTLHLVFHDYDTLKPFLWILGSPWSIFKIIMMMSWLESQFLHYVNCRIVSLLLRQQKFLENQDETIREKVFEGKHLWYEFGMRTKLVTPDSCWKSLVPLKELFLWLT